VGEAGAVTGPIHLIGGILASLGTRGCCPGLRWSTHAVSCGYWWSGGLHAIPSFWPSGRTRCGWEVHVLDFIPAIYFYIGPCMGCCRIWRRITCDRVHRLVAAGGKCLQSDRCPQLIGCSAIARGATEPTPASLRLALLTLRPPDSGPHGTPTGHQDGGEEQKRAATYGVRILERFDTRTGSATIEFAGCIFIQLP